MEFHFKTGFIFNKRIQPITSNPSTAVYRTTAGAA